MLSKRHDFLLMKGTWQPFDTSESFTVYIEKAFQRHNGGLKFTTTTLRKALVNWLMCNEKEDKVRNSVARLMSHSPQVQHLCCNTDDSARKIKRAADHLTS